MKKTYERPVLMTEPFDAEDVITLSEPVIADEPHLGTTHNNFPVDDIPLGDVTIN